MPQSGIEPGSSCTAGEHSMQRGIQSVLLNAIRNLGLYYYSSTPPKPWCHKLLIVDRGWVWIGHDIFDQMRRGPNGERGSKELEPQLNKREQGARTSEPCEIWITSGSPLCRGSTRATYILCIEHPRPKRLSRESNPGPSALQANTLCKEPFEQR